MVHLLLICCYTVFLSRELQQTITVNIYRISKIKGKNELRKTNKDLGGFGEKGKDYPLKTCISWGRLSRCFMEGLVM
jgi:hypothetical protein